ncbi:hypothetical protein V1525DRAFT_405464 [Lipomyces kononenkoae]|uniref:Uncharacterized protein n=1 Tax=Lipomyces kononenkoae TaxID=34357 RepID=A0ACC3SZ80_LIPKO
MSYSRPHLHHQLLNHPPQPQPTQPQHPQLQQQHQHPHQLAPPQQQQTQAVQQVQHHHHQQQLPLHQQQQQQHIPILTHPLHHPPPPATAAQAQYSTPSQQQQQRTASSVADMVVTDTGGGGSGKKKTQQSWVWNYFSKVPGQDGIMYAVCQLPSASPGSGKAKNRRKDVVDDEEEDDEEDVDVNGGGGVHDHHRPRRSTDFMREVVGVNTSGDRPASSVGSQDDASGSGGKCNAQYKYIQGTKNLIRHLIRTHNIFKTTAPASAHDIAALAAAAANPNANSYPYGDDQRDGNAGGANGAESRYSWMSADSLSGGPSSSSFMSAAAPTYIMQDPSPMPPPTTTSKLKHWSDEELIALLQAHHDVRSARGSDAEFLPLDDLVEDTYTAFCARQDQMLQQHQHQQSHAADDSEVVDQNVRRPPKAVYDKLYGLVSSYKFITDYEEDRINRERSAIGTAITTNKKPWWDMSPSDHRRVLGKNRTWLSKSVYNTVAILMPQSLLRRNGTRPSRRSGEEDVSEVSESDSPNASRTTTSANKRRRSRTSTAGSQATPTNGRKKRSRAETLLRTLADAMHDVSGSDEELDEAEAELLGAAAGRRRPRIGSNFERQMLTEQAAQTSLLRTLVEQQTRMMGALDQALRRAENQG